MKRVITLLTFLIFTVSCSSESSNVSGLISGPAQLALNSLTLTTLAPVNSVNEAAYTVAGTCTLRVKLYL